METDARKDVTRRQRFGLIFGLNLTKTNYNFDDKNEEIYKSISSLPWNYFSMVEIPGKKWKWSDVSNSKLSYEEIRSCFKLQDCDVACDVVHRLLDDLTTANTFLLDIVCVCDKVPGKNIPAVLYGLFRRAKYWHGARLSLVQLGEEELSMTNFFEDIFLDVANVSQFCKTHQGNSLQQNVNVFWRGDVSFFDEDSKAFVGLSDFQLSAKDSLSLVSLEKLMNKNKRLLTGHDKRTNKSFISRRFKILSRCHLSTVPPYYLTKFRFSLSCLYGTEGSDEMVKNFLNLASDSIGLIARLDFSPAKTTSSFMDSNRGQKSRLNTDHWKKWILNGMPSDEDPCVDEALSNKPIESIFFLIFDTWESSGGEKCCILLDQNANGHTRGFEVMQDILFRDKSTPTTFEPTLPSVEFSVDINHFQKTVQLIRQNLFQTLRKEEPQLKKEELNKIFEIVLEQCVTEALIKNNLLTHTTSGPIAAPSDDEINNDFVDEANWEERRFLSLLDHYSQLALERKQRSSTTAEGTMKPSGDFVVMEAKELVKLFDASGNAAKGTVLQPMNAGINQKAYIAVDQKFLASPSNWPSLLWTNSHDLYYNKDEKSECQDRDSTKTQQIYVGLKETVSTCNSQNSGKDPEVITKSLTTCQPPPIKTPDVPSTTVGASQKFASGKVSDKSRPRYPSTILRKSPRKMVASQRLQMAPPSTTSSSSAAFAKSQDDLFRQKLRNAVYFALSSRGIDEKSSLFRPCFKKLFDICKMYAQDMPAKVRNGGGTKLWLLKVANQNAITVIDIEKASRE